MNRPQELHLIRNRCIPICVLVCLLMAVILASGAEAQNTVEQWNMIEFPFEGPSDGNPFIDVSFGARFTHGSGATYEVAGFYDGGGVYRVRFMPDAAGEWSYVTTSSETALDGETGSFKCTPATGDNHGPVRVRDTYHFAYADGTPYIPVGTTCYAWVHQGDGLEEKTLDTLSAGTFNKIRMCIFPKHYAWNRNDPVYYPYEGTPPEDWDFSRFDPAFWRHLESRIADLRDLGIEADLILFHTYDRWGFEYMSDEEDDRYIRYAVARLAAFRNVWWSMANEYDLMPDKEMEDWHRFGSLVMDSDPYNHLRSIHNGDIHKFYDHSRDWVTHVSVQYPYTRELKTWRRQYNKPVIDDECEYEGNVDYPWGNLTAREMVHRFWQGFADGCFVGHGETYLHPDDILWWSKGGVLHGDSPPRIAFLRGIIEDAPPLNPDYNQWYWLRMNGASAQGYHLIYFGNRQPSFWQLRNMDGGELTYTIDVIDTWEMTITPLDGTFREGDRVPLPEKPWQAIRVRSVDK